MAIDSKKTQQEMVLHSNGSKTGACEHFVQFCETDVFLVNSLSEFIGAGLRTGDACIVLATKPHRKGLERRLQLDGLEVTAARERGQYVSIDAAAMLSELMVDGVPEADRFTNVIGNMIARAAKDRGQVRIFGELVALLWADGKRTSAIRLEELWNKLSKSHRFSLFCAYPMHGFGGEEYEAEFAEICKQHTRVIPAESYTTLVTPDEQLRAITLLQQKARSLEAEIAERKAAEERLRASEVRYRRLFEASKDGILMVEPRTGKIIDANPFMTELLGYSREQLLGRKLWHLGLFQDRETMLAGLRELQQKHFLRYESLPLHTKDGQLRHVEFVSTLYQTNGHKVIQCTIHDMTGRIELERRKDEFISMASHELKTPVTSIKGFTQLLIRRFQQQGDEEALGFLTRMDSQLDKLTQLIRDLLDVSKMQTGQLDYRDEPLELDVLVQEVVENVQRTTRTHSLILKDLARVRVFGDRNRLGQVLTNLLTNAIKYSPQANKVLVQVVVAGTQAVVSVQDFGIGIAEVHQKKIFERFYQVNEPRMSAYSGLGIGLSIASEIIKRHNGHIWVESRKGADSTFSFSLPLLENRATARVAPTSFPTQ